MKKIGLVINENKNKIYDNIDEREFAKRDNNKQYLSFERVDTLTLTKFFLGGDSDLLSSPRVCATELITEYIFWG